MSQCQVMISNYQKYYKLCEYFSRYSDKRIGFIIGVDNLVEMFEEKYYKDSAHCSNPP